MYQALVSLVHLVSMLLSLDFSFFIPTTSLKFSLTIMLLFLLVDGQKFIEIAVTTDSYPAENGWTLVHTATSNVTAVGTLTIATNPYSHSYCVPEAQYTFTITDSYGGMLPLPASSRCMYHILFLNNFFLCAHSRRNVLRIREWIVLSQVWRCD